MRFAYLLVVALLFVPAPVVAGGSMGDHWVCDQVGQLNGDTYWAFSAPFHDEEYVDPMDFEDAVDEQTDGEFDGAFDARCHSFESDEDANRYLKKRIEKAHKRKLMTLHIKFP